MAILDLPTNPELLARNQQRADAVKQQMGTNYLLHPANRVTRISGQFNLAQTLGVQFRQKVVR